MKTITFYSYKGGVGRTLALANIAKRLSEFGKKVCLIDFDLEAPGLHHPLSPDSTAIAPEWQPAATAHLRISVFGLRASDFPPAGL